jgi:Ca2+-binding EF-hand superfamily protein
MILRAASRGYCGRWGRLSHLSLPDRRRTAIKHKVKKRARQKRHPALGSKTKRHNMDYHQFSQMLRGQEAERVRQVFQQFDVGGDGYIEPDEFALIIRQPAHHKLSDHLLEPLAAGVITVAKARRC